MSEVCSLVYITPETLGSLAILPYRHTHTNFCTLLNTYLVYPLLNTQTHARNTHGNLSADELSAKGIGKTKRVLTKREQVQLLRAGVFVGTAVSSGNSSQTHAQSKYLYMYIYVYICIYVCTYVGMCIYIHVY